MEDDELGKVCRGPEIFRRNGFLNLFSVFLGRGKERWFRGVAAIVLCLSCLPLSAMLAKGCKEGPIELD